MITIAQDLFKPKQNKWVDNSNPVGYDIGQISDEEYQDKVYFNDPIWRYIVRHYPKEVYDENVASIVIVGYGALPVGIELSQWSYPITFLTDSPEEMYKAQRDCEIHAGFLKNLFYFPYRKNVPKATIICAIGVLDNMKSDQIKDFVEMLMEKGREILLVANKRVLGDPSAYVFEAKSTIFPFPDGEHILIAIRP